jgi:DNA polymerase-3 subunit epsilon
MNDFAAIDFETANNERTSVCSVGVVIYRDGKKVDEFYSLVKPEPEYYTYWTTQVHGLTLEDTMDASVFPDVWAQVEPKLHLSAEDQVKLGTEYLPLVAHNKAFDETCLKAGLEGQQPQQHHGHGAAYSSGARPSSPRPCRHRL